jgi:hypothetical protein
MLIAACLTAQARHVLGQLLSCGHSASVTSLAKRSPSRLCYARVVSVHVGCHRQLGLDNPVGITSDPDHPTLHCEGVERQPLGCDSCHVPFS